MLRFSESKKLSVYSSNKKQQGNVVGFVPTMGALHDGHMSLIQQALNECDVVICSIFVNPTQFNNKNDLKNYPIEIDSDMDMLNRVGCTAVFIPSVEEIYPEDFQKINLDLNGVDLFLEGEHRPGHFSGVITVVNKLFDIVKPNKAYFGQKDFQQYCVIKEMASQLNRNVEVVVCPTKREKDGLAMSSRNLLLSNENREKAPIIYKTLAQAAQQSSTKDVAELLKQIKSELSQEKNLKLDYVEIADIETLEPIKAWEGRVKAQVFVAAFFGDVRLIDNITLIREK